MEVSRISSGAATSNRTFALEARHELHARLDLVATDAMPGGVMRYASLVATVLQLCGV